MIPTRLPRIISSAALLAFLPVGALAQVADPELSQRLYLESYERRAVFDMDSSFALLRASREADPANLVAHHEYISSALPYLSGGQPALRREYEDLPPSAACLRLAASVSQSALPEVGPDLIAIQERDPTDRCPPLFLASMVSDMKPAHVWGPRRREYLKDALSRVPGAWWLSMDYAGDLGATGDYEEAVRVVSAAITRFRHPIQSVRLNMRLAGLLLDSGDTAAAEALNRAVRAAVARDGRPGVRAAYLRGMSELVPVTSGSAYDSVLAETAELAAQNGGWLYEWYSRRSMASLSANRGDAFEALEQLNRVVFVADSVGSVWAQIISLTNRGRALSRLGRLDESERDLLRAVELSDGAKLPYLRADAFHQLAHLYESQGRLAEASWAVDHFVKAIAPLWHSNYRMTAWLDAGSIRWKAGLHASAQRALDSMLVVVDEHDANHYFAGRYKERLGELDAAEAYYLRAMELDPSTLTLTLAGVSRVRLALGDTVGAEAAAREHDAALGLNEAEVPLFPGLLANRGVYDPAVEILRDWADQRLAGGGIRAAAIANIALADMLVRADRPGEALDVLDTVDSLVAKVGLVEEGIEARRVWGLALWTAGDSALAVTTLAEAAALASDQPSLETVRATYLALGTALAAAGRPLEALDAFRTASDQVDVVTVNLEEDFDRVRYRHGHLEPFDRALGVILDPTALLDDRDRLDLAIEWTDRRSLAALSVTGLDLGAAPGPRLTRAAILDRLAAGEALVEYVVLEDQVAAIVISRDWAELAALEIMPDSASHLVAMLREPLERTYGGRIDLARSPFDSPAAASLGKEILEPLLSRLTGINRLYIVPDGVLHRVPFAALIVGAKRGFVVDRYETLYLPASRFLPTVQLARVASDGRLFVLETDAPGSGLEAEAVMRNWHGSGRSTAAGTEATESALRAAASRSAVVHLAAHAVADDRDPLASHVRLVPDSEDDGLLHPVEISAIDWEDAFVVLSACETASGPLFGGAGLFGLSRAFLVAGASGVVATQWPIGASAADFMASFYSNLAVSPSSTALRAAQLDMRHSPETAHPFHWAGYVLHVGR